MGRSAEWQRLKNIFPELMSSRWGKNWTVLNTVFSVLTWSHLLAQYHQAAGWLTGVRALCRSLCPSATHICPFSSASIRLNWSVWQGQSRKSTFSWRSQLLFSILCHLNQSISIWRFFSIWFPVLNNLQSQWNVLLFNLQKKIRHIAEEFTFT